MITPDDLLPPLPPGWRWRVSTRDVYGNDRPNAEILIGDHRYVTACGETIELAMDAACTLALGMVWRPRGVSA